MTDDVFMRAALHQAQTGLAQDEVPVGAVIVYKEEIIAEAHNLKEAKKDPTAHAEMVAIQQACHRLGRWRLSDCTMYVTLEPCPMCAGAMVQSRLKRLVYGVHDEKAGAAGSVVNLLDLPRLNHRVLVTSGILAEDCLALLKLFFAQLRKK